MRLRLVGDLRLDQRRAHVGGADRGDADAVLGAFERERLHQAEHAVLRGHVAGLERRGDEAVHRSDREEAAVAALRERLPAVLGEQERARQQQREQRVPAVLGELRDRSDVLEARVRDDRVEPPEALERRIDCGAVPVRVVRSASKPPWRSTPRTPQPSPSRRDATARPIPPAAPVTIATRSVVEELRDTSPGLGRVEDAEVRAAEDGVVAALAGEVDVDRLLAVENGAPGEVVRRAGPILGRDRARRSRPPPRSRRSSCRRSGSRGTPSARASPSYSAPRGTACPLLRTPGRRRCRA